MKTDRLLFAGCVVLFFVIVSASRVLPAENERKEGLHTGQLPPPGILSPSDMAEIRGIFRMSFSWSDVPKAAGYHFVLASDRRFRNIVYENARVPGPACVVENLSYGTYFYRISSVAGDGSEGPFSEVRTFIIVPSPPPVK